MSFLEYKKAISEGDVVIVCKVLLLCTDHQSVSHDSNYYLVTQGFDKMFPVTVTKGHVIQVRGGAVHHDDLIGKPYGSKVKGAKH